MKNLVAWILSLLPTHVLEKALQNKKEIALISIVLHSDIERVDEVMFFAKRPPQDFWHA